MAVITTHRFTVADYHRMAEAGVFRHDQRVELLNGEIRDMLPPGPGHSGGTNRLAHLFAHKDKGRFLVWNQSPLSLNEDSEPQPDVMLVKPQADFYSKEHPTPADVFLVIEVADSSLSYDRNEKLPAYGRAGIPEFWIVNVPKKCVEVYREPHFTGYAKTAIVKHGGTVAPEAFPDIALAVADLLP